MYNRLDTKPAFDRQTSCHGMVRAMYTRRAVKTNRNSYAICRMVLFPMTCGHWSSLT